MKTIRVLCFAAIAATLGSAATAGTQVSAGVTVTDNGVKGFYLAIGETYKAPEAEVLAIRERRVSDEELPVVFFIARRAGVLPRVVVDFRLGGHSWIEVSRHFGLDADVFYVECREIPKGPHGKAFGYYRNRPRSEWKDIRLGDDDVINLVNVRFVMDRYHYPVEEVCRLRENSRNYVVIHREADRGRHKEIDKEKVVVVEPTKSRRGHKHDDN
jgi:hypothetical protein